MRIRRGGKLAGCIAGSALAGAAQAAPPASVETNAADDATFALSRRVDPDGLSLLRESRLRSPSGFLYPHPLEPPGFSSLGEDWKLRGFAAFGWEESWGGSKEAYFQEYSDFSDGPIDAALLEARHAPSGGYLELGLLDLGRDDASAFLDAGRRGFLRLRAFYDRLPHRYAGDARVLFAGAGSERLTLPAPLVPGGNSDAAIDAAIAGRPESRLALQRDRAGVELQLQPNPVLALRAGYRMEEREGERPFGGAIRFAFLNPNIGSVVETVEPLDSRTHDFFGGLSLTHQRIQLELGYEGSIFDNRVETLTWENPFPATNVDRGRFALAPDNQQHRLHGTLSYPLPWRGRWTSTASWISARQNERLVAPTLNAAFPDWIDPETALTSERAGARVDTTVLTSTLRLSPLRRLSVGGKVRYEQRVSHTDWVAQNPSTGEFGYVIEDGSFGVASRYAAAPFEGERLQGGADATLRVFSRTRVSLEYALEQVDRDQRARSRTREHVGRVSLSTRRIPKSTLRLSYEISDRGGSSFDRSRDSEFYSAGPPDFAPPPIGTPARSLSSFDQHDLSDRLRHAASARLGLQLGDISDLAFTGGFRQEDYDARHGLQEVRAANVNVELTIQPSTAFDAYAFGGAEWGERELDTIDSATFVGTDFSPGGPVFPLDHAWSARSRLHSYNAGAGASFRPFKTLELRADYQLLLSRDRVRYDFASAAALAPGTTAQAAGGGFPTLRNTDHILEATARVDLTEWLAAHLLYRFQRSTIDNYQQSGLVPRIGRTLYLAHVDGDFDAHVVGGSVQVEF